jgi:hypothetical protein
MAAYHRIEVVNESLSKSQLVKLKNKEYSVAITA